MRNRRLKAIDKRVTQIEGALDKRITVRNDLIWDYDTTFEKLNAQDRTIAELKTEVAALRRRVHFPTKKAALDEIKRLNLQIASSTESLLWGDSGLGAKRKAKLEAMLQYAKGRGWLNDCEASTPAKPRRPRGKT